MKKLAFLLALALGLSTTAVFAQDQRDPAQMAQRMKERMKPQLVEKTKLSDAEAEKVMDAIIEQRAQMRGLRDLSPEDRQKKMDEMNVELEKKLTAIPLTKDQVKSVIVFLEEQRKQQRERMQQQGGGGGR